MEVSRQSLENGWNFQGVDLERMVSTEKIVRSFTRQKRKSKYDSVVIAGSGIGALCLAARLSRSEEFAGKVTIIAPPIIESRRLIDGVSLRGRAADYICMALGINHDQLIAQITGHASGKPACYRATSSMAYEKNGNWHFTKSASWLGGKRGSDRPIIYGARNSRTVAGMWELMQGLCIPYIEERVESTDQMRDHAFGSNPLLINVTTNPTLLGNEPPAKTTRRVVAVQAPLIVQKTGLKGPAESSTAYAPLIRRDGIIDVGFVTPFADPLSPRSSWYAILARVVDEAKGFDKDYELKTMTDELIGMCNGLGLDVDDPQETLAAACVPSATFGKPRPSKAGTLELKSAYYGGNPAYYADGMISAAMGGLIGAEAIINGDDPTRAVWNAGRGLRISNYLWWIETTKLAGVVDATMRLSVRLAMSYPHSAGFYNWAAAA